jgi:hypothetical protein
LIQHGHGHVMEMDIDVTKRCRLRRLLGKERFCN